MTQREEELTVSVKPLEWQNREPGDGRGFATTAFVARCLFGTYTILFRNGDGDWSATCHQTDFYEKGFETADEAKVAASADYEARILSALVATPKPEATEGGAHEKAARLVEENRRLREVLQALLIQALQSELNTPAHEWGMEAISNARAALTPSPVLVNENEATEAATLKERLRAATVARDAARKALEQGHLNLIPGKVFDAVHEASGNEKDGSDAV